MGHFGIFLVLAVVAEPIVAKDTDLFARWFTTDYSEYEHYVIETRSTLPSHIRGTWIRNGFGRFEMGPRKFTHAFDAYAKLFSFSFHGNGTVTFTDKMISTDSYKASLKQDTVAAYVLFDSVVPPFSKYEKALAAYRGIDNTNINIYRYGPPDSTKLVAVSDFWPCYVIDSNTLNTERKSNPRVPGAFVWSGGIPVPSSSHPMPEYGTNNHINFVTLEGLLFPSYINIIRTKAIDDRENIASIRVDRVPYMHSFGQSKNYAVIFAHPLYVNYFNMAAGGSPFSSLNWEPDKLMTIYAVNIKTGEHFGLTADPIVIMHQANAYEVTDERGGIKSIVLDVVTYPNLDVIFAAFRMEMLLDPEKRRKLHYAAKLKRYIIDINDRSVQVETPAHTTRLNYTNTLDMPVINENYRYSEHCVIYGIVNHGYIGRLGLVKKNMCDPTQDRSWIVDNHFPTEPWFVPNPNGVAEDDGTLLSVVLDAAANRSYIIGFNAMTFEVEHRLFLPVPVPFTLHGRFFDNIIQ